MGLHPETPPSALTGNAVATYVSSLAYAAWYGGGRMVGRFGSILDFGAAFFHDPRPFFMVARLACVAAGTLSVCLAFLVGRRLLDRWFGLVLGLLVAVHPAAVAHTQQAQSHAFALTLVLFGCWAALSMRRGFETVVADLTMGFCVGLAAEATPAYLVILPLYLAYRAWTARSQHLRLTLLALPCALGPAYAGMLVAGCAPTAIWAAPCALYGYAQLLGATSTAWLTVVGALVVALSYLLRPRLTPMAAAGALLAGALMLTGPAFCRSVENDAMRSVPPTTELAASWIADNIPTGSTILIGQDALASLALPRTEQSWRRELAHGTASQQWPCSHSEALCLVGMYAARSRSEPAFDLVLRADPYALEQPTHSPTADRGAFGEPAKYIIDTASSDSPHDTAFHLEQPPLPSRRSLPFPDFQLHRALPAVRCR